MIMMGGAELTNWVVEVIGLINLVCLGIENYCAS